MNRTLAKGTEIELKEIDKSFQGREAVLKGVSMVFPRGQLTYILGTSGAGKSVLLKHILGLLRPDRGEVWVDGEEISRLKAADLNRVRLKFGLLFQNAALFDDMTVFENIAFPLREHTEDTEAQIREKVTSTLSILGMSSGWDKYPNELSGGMKKRVGLARAVVREPKALLYDEPTTGLDPVTRTTVDELISTLKQQMHLTSIVISHDIPSALLLADFIVFLDQGKFIFSGSPQEFRLAQHPVIQSFLESERRWMRALQSEPSPV